MSVWQNERTDFIAWQQAKLLSIQQGVDAGKDNGNATDLSYCGA